jgi:hypothetical protein
MHVYGVFLGVHATRIGLGFGIALRFTEGAHRANGIALLGTWRSGSFIVIWLRYCRCNHFHKLEADPAHVLLLTHQPLRACGCYAQPGLRFTDTLQARTNLVTVRTYSHVNHFYNSDECQETHMQPTCFRWWCHPTPPMRTSAG